MLVVPLQTLVADGVRWNVPLRWLEFFCLCRWDRSRWPGRSRRWGEPSRRADLVRLDYGLIPAW